MWSNFHQILVLFLYDSLQLIAQNFFGAWDTNIPLRRELKHKKVSS